MLMLLFLLALFIPLSVDEPLKFSLFGFSARIGYVVTVLWSVFHLKSILNLFQRAFQYRLLLAGLIVMSIAAMFGTAQSENIKRSLVFSVWTIGTLAVVPFVMVPALIKKSTKMFMFLFQANMVVHSLVVIYDFISTRLGGQAIGIVMSYGSHDHGILHRPHGWYQEPGYFCGFMLIACLGVFLYTFKNHMQSKKIGSFVLITTFIAIILTTSRIGWLGSAWLGGAFALSNYKTIFQWLSYAVKKHKAIFTACLLVFGIGLWMGRGQIDQIYHHVGKGLINPSKDGSFIYRFARLQASLDVFKENKWVGAGPGSAGAYFVRHFPEHDLVKMSGGWNPELVANDPLSHNLYTETLSEWGLLGSLGFLLVLIYMVFNPALGGASTSSVAVEHLKTGLSAAAPKLAYIKVDSVMLLGLLAILFASWQTLPRFDLWVALGMVFYIRRQRATDVSLKGDA